MLKFSTSDLIETAIPLPPEATAFAQEYIECLSASSKLYIRETTLSFGAAIMETLSTHPAFKSENLAEVFQVDHSLQKQLAIYRALSASYQPSSLSPTLAPAEKSDSPLAKAHELLTTLKKHQDEMLEVEKELFRSKVHDGHNVLAARLLVATRNCTQTTNDLTALKQSHPDVAAQLEYERLCEYTDQLNKHGFIWTQSLQDLFRKVVSAATHSHLIRLQGETGTGKTAFVEALAKLLTGRLAYTEIGIEETALTDLLCSPSFTEKTLYLYNTCLQAITGKEDQHAESTAGGLLFLDEFNSYPSALQLALLKFLSSAKPGAQIRIPETGLTEKVIAEFLCIVAQNPLNKRYSKGRAETPLEAERQFGDNEFEFPFLPQSPENPELFQLMCACLLDPYSHRYRAITKDEVCPEYKLDSSTQTYKLADSPQAGGFLWRLANAWHELFNAFCHDPNVLTAKNPTKPPEKYYLEKLNIGYEIMKNWLITYRSTESLYPEGIETFIKQKIKEFLAKQPISANRTVAIQILAHFDIDLDIRSTLQRSTTPLDSLEIGYLFPNVPRPLIPAPTKAPQNRILTIVKGIDGKTFHVLPTLPANLSDFGINDLLVPKTTSSSPEKYRILGQLQDQPDMLVIEDLTKHGEYKFIPQSELAQNYDKEATNTEYIEKFQLEKAYSDFIARLVECGLLADPTRLVISAENSITTQQILVPTWEQVKNVLLSNPKYPEKAAQFFSPRLIISPKHLKFAALVRAIAKINRPPKDQKRFAAILDLSPDEIDKIIKYNGKSKRDLSPLEIDLVEGYPEIEQQGTTTNLAGRPALACGHESQAYLDILSSNPIYKGEQPMDLEDVLWLMIADKFSSGRSTMTLCPTSILGDKILTVSIINGTVTISPGQGTAYGIRGIRTKIVLDI